MKSLAAIVDICDERKVLKKIFGNQTYEALYRCAFERNVVGMFIVYLYLMKHEVVKVDYCEQQNCCNLQQNLILTRMLIKNNHAQVLSDQTVR